MKHPVGMNNHYENLQQKPDKPIRIETNKIDLRLEAKSHIIIAFWRWPWAYSNKQKKHDCFQAMAPLAWVLWVS